MKNKMNIVYLSGACSQSKFNELKEKKIIQKLPQAQKYHNLLMKGLKSNIDGNIFALSSYPVNRRWTKKSLFFCSTDNYDGIDYFYPFFINFPILRQLCLFIFAFFKTFIYCRKNEYTVVLIDVLTKSIATGARLAAKLKKVKTIGIVTDVPGYTSGARRKTLPLPKRKILDFIERLSANDLDNDDGYLLLTEAMNEIVNPKKKPYIVLEGHSDIKMKYYEKCDKNKSKRKIMLYSGGIHKEFGIERMVQAFIEVNDENWELHIYGDGNYKEELKRIAKYESKIKYYGVVDNEEVVRNQVNADLLINPRLTDAEYIKYSFPSKNMEYMASGTPMLTTNLPGMPEEYHKYIYLICDESVIGFKESMSLVFSLSDLELDKKGISAKFFILEQKNNVIQAKRLIDEMLRKELW